MSFGDVLDCRLTNLNILVLAFLLEGLVLGFLFLPLHISLAKIVTLAVIPQRHKSSTL